MNSTATHRIEVDEEVYTFLRSNAEPFKDTPNSVLRRFLPLGRGKVETQNDSVKKVFPNFPAGVPQALQQTLEVIRLVRGEEGLSRRAATNTVAAIRRIARSTVMDKYCRQLGKKAHEMDMLLMDSNIGNLKTLLVEQFPHHKEVIESTFAGIDG